MWRGFLFIFASMKAKAFAIGLFLLALVACRPSTKVVEPAETPSPELLTVDSLLWQQPDTALACLVSCFDACTTTEYNRHYANLLLSELLYKNDYAQTNRPELQQAVAYYDSLVGEVPPLQTGLGGFPPLKGGKGNSKHKPISNNDHFFLAARAHYINGVGYYENDSVIEACREYLKALEIMEEHFEEKELVGDRAKFLALAYTHLMGLFSDFYLHEQAIHFAKYSIPYYLKLESPSWHLSWVLNEIGSHYEMMKELDSADYYYRQAIHYLPDTTYRTYRDITARRAILLYDKEKSLEKALSIMYRLASMAMESKELLARYLFIGDIYYYEKQFDSAWVYLKYVFDNTQSFDSKLLAAERLREISMYNGDTIEAKEYALIRSQHATLKDEDGKLHSALSTLCQQHEHNRQEAQHRLKTQKAARRWGIALVLAAFVVSVVSLLLVILRRRMRTEQYSHKMEQAALSGRLKRSNEELRELKGQISQQEKNKTVPKVESAATFAEEPVCQLIMERVNKGQFKSQMDCRVYKDFALSKAQLSALREAADCHFNRFTYRLSKDFPELTKTDLDYCCLYLLDLSDADISALMQRAYNTVNERNTKLKKVFGAHKSLFSALQDIAREYSSN